MFYYRYGLVRIGANMTEQYGFTPHRWFSAFFGSAIRECESCGKREAYWDDEEYPIDPCPGDAVDAS